MLRNPVSGTVWGLVVILIIICVWWTIRFYTGIPAIPGISDIIKKVFGV